MTSPVNSAVFWSLTPLIMPVLGRLVLGERIEPVVVAGALLATLGTGLLVWSQGGHGGGSPLGDALLLLGCWPPASAA